MPEAQATSTAWTEEAARQYLAGGEHGIPRPEDASTSARRLALTVVRQDRPGVRHVLDVASGPGAFLYSALEVFPAADGVWFDFSEAMQQKAQANLAAFGERVRYVLGDFSEVDSACEAGSLDLVVTSAASHHLLLPALGALYGSCFELLAPGGWLANHDIMTPPEIWDRRLRAARDEIRAQRRAPTGPSHDHPNPMPTIEAHMAAIAAAGFVETQEIWRSAVSCLLLARKPQ